MFRLISDVWFALDVALNFRTGVIEEGSNNQIIIDAREIRRRYVRSWFILDLISTFPFDIAVSYFHNTFNQGGTGNLTGVGFFRYLRLTKLFQVYNHEYFTLLKISKLSYILIAKLQ